MIIIYIILGIIISIFILHFVGLYISDIIRKKYRSKFGYKIGNRITIDVTCEKSLMVSTYHNTTYDYDDDTNEFAHDITLTIGGFYIRFRYGKDFYVPEHYIEEGKVRYYGLYSIDSEKFWRSIWWGKHLYDNPFACVKFVGCRYMNMDTGKWVNRDTIEDCYNIKPPYVVLEEKDTTYINKNNVEQYVPLITWHLEKMVWCVPFLKWIGLSKLYQRKKYDLEFSISQNGSKTFNGIGCDGYEGSNSWKGGVYGASIQLNKYPEILHNMKYANSNIQYLNKFKLNLLDLIDYFMKEEKKY